MLKRRCSPPLRCRKGGYAVAFALSLPVLAAFGAYVADQVAIAHL